MHYNAHSPEDYVAQLDPDWRKEKLLQIREYLLHVDPNLKEGIEYNMLAYGNSRKNLFHLTAQKNYVSLYIGNIEKVEQGRELLSDLDLGKGCIRIKRSIPFPHGGLETFIHHAVEAWNAGKDVDC